MRRRFYISFIPNNSFFLTQTVKATHFFFSPAAKHVPKIRVLLLLNRKHKLFQVIWAHHLWGIYLVHHDVRLYFPLILILAQATVVSGQFNPKSPLLTPQCGVFAAGPQLVRMLGLDSLVM